MKLDLVLVLGLALVAALVGWRATRFRRRSLYDETPAGMSDAAYARRERRRHLIRRTYSAILYGLVGAAVGAVVVNYLKLQTTN